MSQCVCMCVCISVVANVPAMVCICALDWLVSYHVAIHSIRRHTHVYVSHGYICIVCIVHV